MPNPKDFLPGLYIAIHYKHLGMLRDLNKCCFLFIFLKDNSSDSNKQDCTVLIHSTITSYDAHRISIFPKLFFPTVWFL